MSTIMIIATGISRYPTWSQALHWKGYNFYVQTVIG